MKVFIINANSALSEGVAKKKRILGKENCSSICEKIIPCYWTTDGFACSPVFLDAVLDTFPKPVPVSEHL